MKVKFLLIAAMAAVGMSAFANTTATDKLYIKDATAKVGDEIVLSFCAANESAYSTFQAVVTLPEGVTAVQQYDEEEESDVWVLNDYSGRIKKMSITTNVVGQEVRMVAVKMDNKPVLTAGDAQICTIKVKVAKEGELKGTVSKVHFANGQDSSLDGDMGGSMDFATEFTIKAEATGINDINTTDAVKTRKVIENGQLYIISGDKKYNVMGAEVK